MQSQCVKIKTKENGKGHRQTCKRTCALQQAEPPPGQGSGRTAPTRALLGALCLCFLQGNQASAVSHVVCHCGNVLIRQPASSYLLPQWRQVQRPHFLADANIPSPSPCSTTQGSVPLTDLEGHLQQELPAIILTSAWKHAADRAIPHQHSPAVWALTALLVWFQLYVQGTRNKDC